MIQLILYRSGGDFLDLGDLCVELVHEFEARDLERLRFKIAVDDPATQLDYLKVGNEVRLTRNESTVFEGVIYERRISQREKVEVDVTAYTHLIKYERHVVYRSYPTGTKAGEIIRDLASLEEGVDISNVDDGDELLAPWEIENQTALKIMRSVARGVNYWLRMKPNKVLYFKPKEAGSPAATIEESKCLSARYSEDRWELKNRVIYVGANGEVLADVSEGDGDLPVIVHDPFLTSKDEAERRADIRLALNREYGRELEILMHLEDFESLGVDLGDVVSVNLPKIGVEDDLAVLGVEYMFGVRPRVRLHIGGRHQLFEEFLVESIGNDVAARFGKTISSAEETSTLVRSLNAAVKIQADAKTVRLVNRPPLLLENPENVMLDGDGYASLTSGSTSGSFEFSCLPSELFTRWLRIHYDYEVGGGEVRVDLMRVDDSAIAQDIPKDYEFEYLPRQAGWWTEGNASEWGISGGSLADSGNAVVSYWSIEAVRADSVMRIYYPKSRDAGWDLSRFKYLVLYLCSQDDDPDLLIRLVCDEENYFEAAINHLGGAWRKYEILISSMGEVGSPTLSQVNSLELETDLPKLLIDSDHVFIPAAREQLKLKFTLTRPSPDSGSPRIKLAKFVWREGG